MKKYMKKILILILLTIITSCSVLKKKIYPVYPLGKYDLHNGVTVNNKENKIIIKIIKLGEKHKIKIDVFMYINNNNNTHVLGKINDVLVLLIFDKDFKNIDIKPLSFNN